jgi:DNA-binding transcriptional MerR regulator
MYIGKLAKLTGATRRAIRLYENIGLIPTPNRKGKYRVYTDKDVSLVSMIRCAQTVGFNLADLQELIALQVSNNRFPIDMANELVNRKREELRKDIDNIQSLDKALEAVQEEFNRTCG